MYTISALLPTAYVIGLIFTLKTHSHIYDIQISDDHGDHGHGQYDLKGTCNFQSTDEFTASW